MPSSSLFRFIFALVIFASVAFMYSSKRYENLAQGGKPSFFSYLKWEITAPSVKWPDLVDKKPSNSNLKPPSMVTGDDILVTYINHATFLIQLGGKNILTDPVWSDHAGPYGKYGPKRVAKPGVKIEDLPAINYILISHNHYDHLDLPTIEKITQNHNPIIITGLGVTKAIDYCNKNKNRCYEADWWNHLNIMGSEISMHFVPAHHWSGRYLFDQNHSLWGGFVIHHNQDNIYFAGDTAFADGEIFKTIHKKYGDFRLALLPIGDYNPEKLFSEIHTSPAQAVEIFKILNVKYAIPMHFDIFKLSDDAYNQPINDLKKSLLSQAIPGYKFNILTPGQSWYIPNN